MMPTLNHLFNQHPQVIWIALAGLAMMPIGYWILKWSMFDSLCDNEARLSMAMEAAGLGLWDWNPQSQRCLFDERWTNMIGFTRDEIEPHYRSWSQRLHPEDVSRVEETISRCLQDQTDAFHCEFRMRHKEGHWVWIASQGRVAHRNIHGQATRLIGLHQDITPTKLAQQHQTLMMRELDHRVKNNLATVLSLCRETMRSCSSMEDFQRAFEGRIRAMADTHVALANMHWEGLDLGCAIDLVLAVHLRANGSRIARQGPPLTLPTSAALPLCLSLHELMTNATKHGALSMPQGTIDIHWRQNNHQLLIDWTEHHGPTPPKTHRQGTGLQLIQGLIQYELSGQVDLAFDPPGLRCRLTLPLTGKTRG